MDLATFLLVSVAIARRRAAARTARDGSAVALLGSLAEHVRRQPLLGVMLVCVLVTHVLLVASVFSAPPRGFDALWYHLPNLQRIFRSHTLDVQVGSYIEFYPSNAELFGLPLLALENDSWVGLLQYPWFLIAALVTALLARRVGTSPPLAIAAGLTVLTVPTLVHQAMRFYVDLVFAALSLGSLLYLIDWLHGKRRSDLTLCAVTLSMMLGTKYIAMMPWFFVAAIAGVAVMLFHGGRSIASALRRRGTWYSIASIVGIGTVFAWVWWARNLAASGNPIAPISVRLLLGTLVQGKTLGSVFAPPVTESWIVLRSLAESYGVALVLLPAALVAGLWRLRRRQAGDGGAIAIALAYIGWGIFSFFVLLSQDPRFLIAPFLVAVALAASLLAARERAGAGVFLAFALINTAVLANEIALANNFEVSLNSSARNQYYGLPDEIDRLPAGARLLLRGHPALVYPASGASRQLVVYPSPMGPVQDEIERWRIDYVFVRTGEPEVIAELKRLPSLRLIRSSRLTQHSWWHTWPEHRPQFTGLFEVVP
jgi:hypothetical protein